MCQSEKVLESFAKDREETLHFYGDPKKMRTDILAARKTHGWQEFVNHGYTNSLPPELKMDRLKRYLLVGNAIDAFEDVP